MNRLQSKQKKQDSIRNPRHHIGQSPTYSQAADHPYLQAQGIIGNHGILRRHNSDIIQAKLKIGQPNDKYEQEADQVADQVMRMPGPSIQRKPTCPECMEEDEEEILRPKQINNQTPTVTSNIEANVNSLKGSGQPLPEATRSFFEPRFGADFSQVRIHTSTQSAELARSINALAFTVGRDIMFGTGQYAPDTNKGQRLLTHELTHVLQQSKRTGVMEETTTVEKEQHPLIQHLSPNSELELRRQPVVISSTDVKFALEEGIKDAERIKKEGLPEEDSEFRKKINMSLQFYEGDAYKVYSDEIKKAHLIFSSERERKGTGKLLGKAEKMAERSNSHVSRFVQKAVKELDGQSDFKVLISIFLGVGQRDQYQWAIDLNAIYHQQSGNYLLHFIAKIKDHSPKVAEKFIETLEQKGIMVRAIALEVELHRLISKEMIKKFPGRVDIRKYPVYLRLAALGSIAIPVLEVAEIVVHFIPVIGQVIGALEAIIGQELLTGRRLEGWEILLEIIPYAGRIIKLGRSGARTILYISHRSGLRPNSALLVVKNTSTLVSEATQLQKVKSIVESGGKLSVTNHKAVNKAHNALKPLEKEIGAVKKGKKGAQKNILRRTVPDSLKGCRVGSVICALDDVMHLPIFRDHFKLREDYIKYLGDPPSRVDLKLSRSLRRDISIPGGNPSYTRFLREVPENDWTPAFTDAMIRSRRPRAIKDKDFRELNVGGRRERWPLDDLGAPWQVHHEPPLHFGGGDLPMHWRPVPYRIHDQVGRWWDELKGKFLREYPRKEWRDLVSAEEAEYLGMHLGND